MHRITQLRAGALLLVVRSALSARTSDPERVGRALAELARSDVAVREFALGQPTLDEVFLALIGRAPADHATEKDAA
jgi:ABC-2 type transport system ATP-binding protein